MEFSRLPRFKRTSAVDPIQITERDREIIRLVHRYRFLRSPQIAALVDDHSQQLLRRFQLLYHHGYLERPRCQIDSYYKPGSRHIVYGLGNKGWTLVKHEIGEPSSKLSWGEKNRAVGRIFLEHALLVSEVMVAIELACRQSGIRLLTEQELAVSTQAGRKWQPFRWHVRLNPRLRLGVVPDRVFALEFSDHTGNTQRTLFFLEADRGTMPVVRNNLSQTSFYRKLLAYEATWSQGIHRRRFGCNRFRVLTITTIPGRVESLSEACAKLKRGRGLFLFANRSVLDQPPSILSASWQTGPGETSGLLG